jgi:hypothetical protein
LVDVVWSEKSAKATADGLNKFGNVGTYTVVPVEIKKVGEEKSVVPAESFTCRGIGLDYVSCFVCGALKRNETSNAYNHNIAAFVTDKLSGQRVVCMFAQGARLDYRPNEPHWIQVKIGACDKHFRNLKRLQDLVVDDTITPQKITAALEDTK